MNEYGDHADLIMNALGIVNRLNPAQLFEVELNFIAENILRKIKGMKTNKEKLEYLFDFIRTINPNQAKALYNYYKGLDKAGKKKFIQDTEEKGIYLHQPPFWDNITLDELTAIYDKYDFIKPYKCTVKGKPVEHDLIFGSEYILRLKHEASNKFSTRSSAYINMKGAPSKSLTYKKNQDLYSSTPIRLGEMEINNLLLTQKNEVVKLSSMYSSSEENRQYMIEQLLTDDILNMEEIELKNEEDNHNRQILDVYLKSLGMVLIDDGDEIE